MLQAYFDESGTHSGSPVLSVAGYIASDEQWRHFEREWANVLKRSGHSQGKPFHMTDFECRHRLYREWSDEKRQWTIRRLIGIIKRRVRYGFSSSIEMAAYEELIGAPLRMQGKTSLDGAHSAYSLCLADCLKQFEFWANKQSVSDRVAYFFEAGAGFGNDVTRMMSEISSSPRESARFRFGSWSFAEKSKVLPLQAADINAYESLKYWRNELFSDKTRSLRRSFESLLQIPQFGQYIDRADLLRLISQVVSDSAIRDKQEC